MTSLGLVFVGSPSLNMPRLFFYMGRPSVRSPSAVPLPAVASKPVIQVPPYSVLPGLSRRGDQEHLGALGVWLMFKRPQRQTPHVKEPSLDLWGELLNPSWARWGWRLKA